MDITSKIKKIKVTRNIYYYNLINLLSKCVIRNLDGNDNYYYNDKTLLFVFYKYNNILWYNRPLLVKHYMEDYSTSFLIEDFDVILKCVFEEKI